MPVSESAKSLDLCTVVLPMCVMAAAILFIPSIANSAPVAPNVEFIETLTASCLASRTAYMSGSPAAFFISFLIVWRETHSFHSMSGMRLLGCWTNAKLPDSVETRTTSSPEAVMREIQASES